MQLILSLAESNTTLLINLYPLFNAIALFNVSKGSK